MTGAASGMGRCAAHHLAGQGARVAALDVNEEALQRLGRRRPNVVAYPADVTEAATIESVVADVEERLRPIRRVMNAAQIMPTGLLLDEDRETIARVMEVNYGGTVNVTLAALPRMLERGGGELVNFASLAGCMPSLPGAYAASKLAVLAFSEVLAHENRGSGVRFVCVCPAEVPPLPLEQARSRPLTLDLETGRRVMEPEHVLAAIERALVRGRLFVFPAWRTAGAAGIRRVPPGLLGESDHWVERERT